MSKANGDISRLLIAAAGEAWALHEPTLLALQSLLVRHAKGDEQISEAELASIAAAESRGGPKSPAISAAGAATVGGSDGRSGWSLVGTVAHIPVGGVIARYANQVNGNSQPRGTSVESLRTTIAQVRMDPKVRSALLHVDSPGGSVSGLATLAEDLRGLRSHLEAASGSLWSFADGLMASAAYWISAQAGRLLAEPAASVGSIGVYSLVVDDAQWYADRGLKVHMLKAGKDKGIGAPGQSITPEQLTVLQSQVDEFYAMFRGEVKRGRGMSEEAVDRAATGRVWIAEQAKAMGLVDDIAPNVEAVVSRMEELFSAKAKGAGVGGTGGAGGGTRMSMDAGVLPAMADGAGGGGKDAGAAAPQEDPMKARELMEAAGGVNGGGGGGGGGSGGAVAAAGVGGGAPVVGAPVVGLQGQALSDALREIQMAAAPFAHIPKVRELAEAASVGLPIGTHSVTKFRADAMQAVADASSKPMNSVAGGGRGEGVGGLSVTVGSDGRERYRADITLALLGRADPSLESRLGSEPDRERGLAGGEAIAEALGFAKAGEARAAIAKARAGFGSMRLSLKAVMATCVGMAAGISPYQAEENAGGDVMRLMQMACNFGGPMAGAGVTTSDFPLILQNVMHKALLAKFAEAMPKWREIAIKGNFSDYRPKYVYAMSETGDYEEIGERETPTNTSTRERRQSMAAKAYARKYSLTEEMVRNDDLGAFARMPMLMGEAAARVPDKLLAALLALNSGLGPALEDGETLIAAAHNNTLGNTSLSHAALQADITAFNGSQKGFGEDQALIDVEPAILLVAHAHGMTAKEILTSPYKPGGTNQEVNVIRDAVRAVAWRRLAGNRRYLLADPNRLPVFEVGFLDGQETPRVDAIPMVNPREMEWQHTLPGCGVGTTGQYEGIASNQGG